MDVASFLLLWNRRLAEVIKVKCVKGSSNRAGRKLQRRLVLFDDVSMRVRIPTYLWVCCKTRLDGWRISARFAHWRLIFLERVRGARHRIHSWHRFEQHIGDEISLSYVWFCLTLLTTDGRTAVVVVPFDVIRKRDPRARARVRVTAKTIDATFENRWNPVEMTEKWHGS